MKTVIIIAIIFLYSFFIAFIFKQKPHHIPLLCDNILKEIRDEQREFEKKIREIRLEKEKKKGNNMDYSDLEDRSFVGMHFLSYKNGEMENQGQVMESLENGFYLLDYFEWGMGTHSCSHIKNLNEMKEFKFFTDKEHAQRTIDIYNDNKKHREKAFQDR